MCVFFFLSFLPELFARGSPVTLLERPVQVWFSIRRLGPLSRLCVEVVMGTGLGVRRREHGLNFCFSQRKE